MEVFDGKRAAQEYMSKHTLAFSTPDLTLTRFAFWLGDTVPDPKGVKQEGVPRMTTFMMEQDFAPVMIDDDKYEPSGAVLSTAPYGNAYKEKKSGRFCFECGSGISDTAKFCPECGTTQD